MKFLQESENEPEDEAVEIVGEKTAKTVAIANLITEALDEKFGNKKPPKKVVILSDSPNSKKEKDDKLLELGKMEEEAVIYDQPSQYLDSHKAAMESYMDDRGIPHVSSITELMKLFNGE